MDRALWEPARLIPLAGIRGSDDQEMRATSVLLAVMAKVPSLQKALLGDIGAPAGRLAAFTEVTFDDGRGNPLRPDGVLEVVRGKRRWMALVEVKTGRSVLDADQVENYARLARRQGFDAVITISNEFVAPSAPHPIQLPGQLARQVRLAHWSWRRVLTSAVVLRKRHQVSDPEQSWLLDELIRYLDDERSGALFFGGFGRHWVAVRDSARAGTLRRQDDSLPEIVNRWDQFLTHLGLRLSGRLKTDATVVTSREHRRDPATRSRDLLHALATDSRLRGSLRVADTAGDVDLEVDLRARRMSASLELASSSHRTPRARVNWLLRQLRAAPDDARITAIFPRRHSTSELLGSVREDPRLLLAPKPPRRSPQRFIVAIERDMATKGGRGRDSFVEGIEGLTDDFYETVVQHLTPWVERPPQMEPGAGSPADVSPADVSPAEQHAALSGEST